MPVKSSPTVLKVGSGYARPDSKVFGPVYCAEHFFSGPWPCSCEVGPQVVALHIPADEISMGGARGGLKTETLLAFMAKGNQGIKKFAPGQAITGADASYVAHPNYRGLLMREQANDLGDLIDRAEEAWTPLGAKITRGNPAQAEWPSGAKIIFGHFGEDGWKKYVGPQYQRIGFDQMEMMPSREIHDRIVGSCRSKWPELKPQVFSTWNPGGGDDLKGAPGQAWIMDYFRVQAYLDKRLKKYQMVRQAEGKLTVFIPSRVIDNPFLRYKTEKNPEGVLCQVKAWKHAACGADTLGIGKPVICANSRCTDPQNAEFSEGVPVEGDYFRWLRSIEPESLRRAWLDGDMHALSGQYFRDFRPNGPLSGEPDNACHVYDPEKVHLEPWFHAWASLDWGYIHPTDLQFHRKAPWGQTYTFKEIALNRVEPFELGVLIAREARPILDGLESRHMNLYMSPDAWAKRESENTVASQIAAGIRKELGPGSAFLMELEDHERELRSPQEALASMHRRRAEQKQTMLTLVRASTDRVAGWMHMQTMLRFRPLRKVSQPDKEFADRLYQEKGLVAYTEYMNSPEFAEAKEVLPKWQISKECRVLIQTLPRLMHKPGTNDVSKVDATGTMAGDDAADASRMGLFSEELQGTALEPLAARVERRVAEIEAAMPGLSDHSRIMAREHARYMETVGRTQQKLPYAGHNRLAVRRAMLADRARKFSHRSM